MMSMTFDEFDAWAGTQAPLIQEQAFFNEAEHFEDIGARYHKGDLAVDSIMVAPVTVIEGNLTARAIDYDFDVGILVVTGDLDIAHIDPPLSISIVVGGNLTAKSVCIDTLNDYYLFVGGDIVCDHFAELGCSVEVSGKIVCPVVWNQSNTVTAHGGIEGRLISGPRGRDVARVVVADVLDADGYLDRDKLSAWFKAGQSPYLA